ncbi:MAG: sugar phosphate isomerase/epimerase [Candidatus Hydrogenedens sp.]|nr:sugar phosphate isomerase/epimerase [Candidatus Hydrogenedens sp.]
MSQDYNPSRRDFMGQAFAAGTTFALASEAFAVAAPEKQVAGEAKISICTANLVAKVTDYRFKLENWGEQHRKTVEATDASAWDKICEEFAAVGFKAVEVWEAHAAPEAMDEDKGRLWKEIMDKHGLTAIGYGGQLSEKTLEICGWLGIPQINGSIGGNTPEAASELCERAGIRFNVENHPEKTTEEILKVVGGGNEWLGVCIDTGWLGTQGAPGPQIIRECGDLVRHTHIKDVEAVGGHLTCLLGEGVAEAEACMMALAEIGYEGWYSWEDEPEDRNPLDSARRNYEWIRERIGKRT